MNKRRNAKELWESWTIEERRLVLKNLYIKTSLASERNFFKLPGHIRTMFHIKINSKNGSI